ncbi:retrovirus-related pol polyprotein from transposon TNT 1-94 [Tanacetum coccineum]|uniref:Retrovirus-related pol polyprotein from transposon TNT 1-94 n=1 Tax=Tanacetum coccineum TaxID=301880 RepID=A0ABQ5J9U6_9ASTR
MKNKHVRNKCDVTNHQVNIQFLLQLQQEWQRFVTLVKQSQKLKTVSYHKLYDILKQYQNEVNELRAERLAPATRTRGKAIVNSSPPTYDQEPTMVVEDDEMSKEKEIDKLMALISLSIKKTYKPTNNKLRTSSNTSRANQDNTPRINRGTGYDNQRVVNVARARENLGTQVVQHVGIQCYNCKEYGHVARECQKLKRAKDAAYHKEKMLLCKQAEVGFQLNIQEVTPVAADNYGPIFDVEPLQKVQNNDDIYNVFAIESEHPEQPEFVNDTYPVEQDEHNIIIDSLDMIYDREQDDNDDLAKERDLLASLIEKLKCEIDDSKNQASNELSKTNQLMFKDLKKFQADLDRYHDVNYASNVAIDYAKAEGDLILTQISTGNSKTWFLNEIDRLSREYYYADHMNAILGVYTTLDEFTDLQCDYVDQVVKCERLEKELSKSNTASRSFEALQKHAINLELALQQCKEQIKNDKAFKENQSNVFLKEREQYFEIQDLKAQLQDKGIAISELKKLIEKMKGKSVDTKFEKSSVIQQPNAFKSQRQLVLGVILTTSVSRPQLKSNQLEDRVMPNNSQGKKQEIEDPTLVDIILFIVDSGCSKNMTRNLKLLSNFVEKFLGTMKFGNDQIASILGYGDLKSTCYIRDLKENDLLTSSHGTDLYSINLQDTSTPNPICLMAKALSSQTWLWHRRLSHLNFDSINLLSKNDIVIGLPKLKFIKDYLCSSCELGKSKRKSFHTKTTPSSKRRLQLLHMDLCGPMRVESINGKKYVLVIVDDYSRYTWTHFLRSKDETPKVLIDFLKLVQKGLHAQSFVVTTADAPNQRQQQHTTPSTSTTVAADTPTLNIQTTSETTSQAPTQAPITKRGESNTSVLEIPTLELETLSRRILLNPPDHRLDDRGFVAASFQRSRFINHISYSSLQSPTYQRKEVDSKLPHQSMSPKSNK